MKDNPVWLFLMILIFSVIGLAVLVATRNPERLFQERIRKVTYEGHEYLYLIYNRGICHSPECKCQTKGEPDEQK